LAHGEAASEEPANVQDPSASGAAGSTQRGVVGEASAVLSWAELKLALLSIVLESKRMAVRRTTVRYDLDIVDPSTK
jgi:hypothetical protein